MRFVNIVERRRKDIAQLSAVGFVIIARKKTLDYKHPEAFIKTQANNWWSSLSYNKRVEIYLKEK
jgi:hypothetical protein